MAGAVDSSTTQVTNTWPKSRSRSKSSGGNGVKKSTSTESQKSFEIIEVHNDSNRSIPATPGASPRAAKKVTKANLQGGSLIIVIIIIVFIHFTIFFFCPSRNSTYSRSGSDNDKGKRASTVKDPLKGQVPQADKQPTLNPNTPRIPKLPKQQRSKQGSVEWQMCALLISDEDLDRYNLNNSLAEAMDLSEKDWD